MKEFRKLANLKDDFKLSLKFYDMFLYSEPVADFIQLSKAYYFNELYKKSVVYTNQQKYIKKIIFYYNLSNKTHQILPF